METLPCLKNQWHTLCGCGCGERVNNAKSKYLPSHFWRMSRPSPRKGKKCTDETKLLLRNINLGRKATNETKIKMSRARFGKKMKSFSMQARLNMSKARNGKGPSREAIQKGIATKKSNNYHHTQETKNKIGNKNKGKKQTVETRNAISKSMLGKPARKAAGWHHTEETKAKLQIISKGRKHSEKTKAKQSAAKLGRSWNSNRKKRGAFTDEHRKNISLAKLNQKKGPCSLQARINIRNGQIRRVEKQALKGQPLMPCIGHKENKCLDYIAEIFNLKIVRQYRVAGFFLDGYIKEHNLAFEFDETSNHSSAKAQAHDVLKRNDIIRILSCKYININENEWFNNQTEVLSKIKLHL